jgi:hypothetical protein
VPAVSGSENGAVGRVRLRSELSAKLLAPQVANGLNPSEQALLQKEKMVGF